MKKVRLDLKEHATKTVNHGKKREMITLIREKNKIHREQKICYICILSLSEKYRIVTHNTCNLRNKTPKELPVLFHNGCT